VLVPPPEGVLGGLVEVVPIAVYGSPISPDFAVRIVFRGVFSVEPQSYLATRVRQALQVETDCGVGDIVE
jgi:hypothetical protein